MICECRDALYDSEGQVVRVDTCPVCLPAGAITWLIENGRQLDMFDEVEHVDSTVSVRALEAEAERASQQQITDALLSATGLPF